MSLHLQRQIDRLKRAILHLGARAEEAVADATQGIEARDPSVAERARGQLATIDHLALEIEEECQHTLALHQPVAFDMRFVIATLKIGGELQRIGALACKLALIARDLAEQPEVQPWPFDLCGLSKRVRHQVSDSLDALVNLDPDRAQAVYREDEPVDRLHAGMYRRIESAIREDPELVRPYILLLSVSRNLERIADHSVRIAAHVLYMASGELVSNEPPPDHQGPDNPPASA